MLLTSSRLSTRAVESTSKERKTASQTEDEEVLSIRSLMARQESAVIIGDPREYQVELFEKAKKENIIAVLDTGKIQLWSS